MNIVSLLENIVKALTSLALTLSMIVSSGGLPAKRFGSAIPVATANFETALTSSITSTDTSMTLVSGTDSTGRSLSGYTCFTVDAGQSTQEFVCGTASGTSITGLTRGVDPLTATTSVTAIQYAHRRGADVKITDFPVIGVIGRVVSGIDGFPAKLHYDSGPTFSSSTDIITKNYADNLVNQGAATSTETNGGIVQLGTLANQANSFNGGAAQPTVLQTKNSTSTCQVTGSYNIVASSTTGKMDSNCFDAAGQYNFTSPVGLGTSTPTSRLSVQGNGYISGTLTMANIVIASSTGSAEQVFTTNGANTTYWSDKATTTKTFIPQLLAFSTSTLQQNFPDNTTAFWGAFSIPYKITVNKIGFAVQNSDVGQNSIKFGIYTDAGAQVTTATAVISGSGGYSGGFIATSTTLSSAVNLWPGVYYIGVIRGGAGNNLYMENYQCEQFTPSIYVSGKPVYCGVTTETANTLPASLTPSNIATTTRTAPYIKLDN